MDIAPERTCMGSTRSPSYSNYKSILTTPVCATQDFSIGKKESKQKPRTMAGGLLFQISASCFVDPLISPLSSDTSNINQLNYEIITQHPFMPCVPFFPIEDPRSHIDFTIFFFCQNHHFKHLAHFTMKKEPLFLGPWFPSASTWFGLSPWSDLIRGSTHAHSARLFLQTRCCNQCARWCVTAAHYPGHTPFCNRAQCSPIHGSQEQRSVHSEKGDLRLTEDAGGNICMLGTDL